MADPLQAIQDALFRMTTAPQNGDFATDYPATGYFQERQSRLPGQSMPVPGLWGEQESNPQIKVSHSLNYGPKTDIDTARGLSDLLGMWNKRSQDNPYDAFLRVDPRAPSQAYSHEAAHGLLQALLGGNDYANEELNSRADKAGIRYHANSPSTKGTEAFAYALGGKQYGGQPVDRSSPALQEYLKYVFSQANSPEKQKIVDTMKKILGRSSFGSMNTTPGVSVKTGAEAKKELGMETQR